MDQLKEQYMAQLHNNPWFDHVQLSGTKLPKGIMQPHVKELLEEMLQCEALSFESVQELLKKEIRMLSRQ